MPYVDGYVLPVPRKNLDRYRALARKAGKIWREHGALEYRECVGDDVNPKFGVPFGRAVKAGRAEVIVFSYVVFKSRAHRDRVNARVMNDPRVKAMCSDEMPFDCKRMTYGGFKVIVDA